MKRGVNMIMRELKRAISIGSEKLSGLHKADKISQEQYSYALRSINLYFRLKDDQ